MPALVPVVESPDRLTAFWCPLPQKSTERWIRVGPEISNDDIALLVFQLADYNKGNSAGPPLSPEAIVRHSRLLLPGGLAALDGDTQIHPSCCCGLEGWRDWFRLLESGVSPWLGHDPDPWVEAKEGGFVVWPGADFGATFGPSGEMDGRGVAFSRDELHEALDQVQSSLAGFVPRLVSWAELHCPEVSSRLGNAFARNFRIHPRREQRSGSRGKPSVDGWIDRGIQFVKRFTRE